MTNHEKLLAVLDNDPVTFLMRINSIFDGVCILDAIIGEYKASDRCMSQGSCNDCVCAWLDEEE